MKRNRRNSAKKERIIMIASSAFVLTALTMTGIYMKSGNVDQQDDGYTIDFTALDDNIEEKMDEIEQGRQDLAQNTPGTGINDTGSVLDGLEDDLSVLLNPDSDLDYPMEVGSGQIEIPGLTDGLKEDAPLKQDTLPIKNTPAANAPTANAPEVGNDPKPEEQLPAMDSDAIAVNEPEMPPQEPVQDTDSTDVVAETLHFSEADGLRRPVSGEVLIPFSMDTTVYFSTLNQFKCNSALVLEAEQGSAVTACADARVVEIFEDEEIGQAVTMELGDGYQITYGQLEALNVTLGDHVDQGEVIGWIAAPTRYYCVEGSNLYLKLTANGKPVNPETLFR